MKKNRTNVLLVVAHPDDEILSFGPLLVWASENTSVRLHVICMTHDTHERSAQFYKSAAFFGFTPFIFGLPDDAEDSKLFDNKVVNALTHYMVKHDIDVVYTHDPFCGDQGRHVHHIETAILTGLAAHNTSADLLTHTHFLFTEGVAENIETQRLSPTGYTALVTAFQDVYASDASYLFHNGENAYHLSSLMNTVTLDLEGWIKFSVGYIASWRSDWLVGKTLPGVDLYDTKDSHFEKIKRAAIVDSVRRKFSSNCIFTNPLVMENEWQILDVGTGRGYTTTEVHSLLRSPLSCIDPFYTPSIPHDRYIQSYDDIPLLDPNRKVISTFFCSAPWVDLDEFIKVLDVTHTLIVDTYLEEPYMKEVLKRFPHVYFDDFNVTGCRDQLFYSVTPIFHELVRMMFASKEPL